MTNKIPEFILHNSVANFTLQKRLERSEQKEKKNS